MAQDKSQTSPVLRAACWSGEGEASKIKLLFFFLLGTEKPSPSPFPLPDSLIFVWWGFPGLVLLVSNFIGSGFIAFFFFQADARHSSKLLDCPDFSFVTKNPILWAWHQHQHFLGNYIWWWNDCTHVQYATTRFHQNCDISRGWRCVYCNTGVTLAPPIPDVSSIFCLMLLENKIKSMLVIFNCEALHPVLGWLALLPEAPSCSLVSTQLCFPQFLHGRKAWQTSVGDLPKRSNG